MQDNHTASAELQSSQPSFPPQPHRWLAQRLLYPQSVLATYKYDGCPITKPGIVFQMLFFYRDKFLRWVCVSRGYIHGLPTYIHMGARRCIAQTLSRRRSVILCLRTLEMHASGVLQA